MNQRNENRILRLLNLEQPPRVGRYYDIAVFFFVFSWSETIIEYSNYRTLISEFFDIRRIYINVESALFESSRKILRCFSLQGIFYRCLAWSCLVEFVDP